MPHVFLATFRGFLGEDCITSRFLVTRRLPDKDLCLENLLVLKGALKRGLHFHVAELGDGKIKVL